MNPLRWPPALLRWLYYGPPPPRPKGELMPDPNALPLDLVVDGVICECPDCGPVIVKPDVFDGGDPVGGVCPTCGDRLYFGPGGMD